MVFSISSTPPSRVGWLTRRIAVVVIVLSFLLWCVATGWAQKAKAKPKPEPDATEEPPLEFTLDVEGKTVQVRLDEPFQIDAGGKKVSLQLGVKPYRTFFQSGVRFRYPNYYEFEAEADSPEVIMWTLSGNDNALMLFKYPKGDSEATLKSSTDAAIEQYGKKNVKQAKCTIKLADQNLSGKRLDITIADATIRQDVYAFTTEGSSFILIVQDSPEDGKKMTEETRDAIKMLQETFEFVGTTGSQTKAPPKEAPKDTKNTKDAKKK